MCLIAFAVNTHPRYRLVMAANRDEFHARPTAAAGFHADDGNIFGGRDLRAGGSWLSLSRRGRIVAVTNVRVGQPEVGQRSRGALVHDWIRSPAPLDLQIETLRQDAAEYGRFNLLAFEAQRMRVLSNHPQFSASSIDDGVHAISNAGLNAPWPKTMALREAVARWIQSGVDDPRALFDALHDPQVAADTELPHTGIGLAHERLLSAAFIRGREYGTRASTIVLMDTQELRCIERTFGPEGVPAGRTDVRIRLD